MSKRKRFWRRRWRICWFRQKLQCFGEQAIRNELVQTTGEEAVELLVAGALIRRREVNGRHFLGTAKISSRV